MTTIAGITRRQLC